LTQPAPASFAPPLTAHIGTTGKRAANPAKPAAVRTRSAGIPGARHTGAGVGCGLRLIRFDIMPSLALRYRCGAEHGGGKTAAHLASCNQSLQLSHVFGLELFDGGDFEQFHGAHDPVRKNLYNPGTGVASGRKARLKGCQISRTPSS